MQVILRLHHSSLQQRILDLNFRGRDRDRAVERSPAFEFLHQLRCLLVVDALHAELKMHGIE